jgi:tetratricopeptide (TPR) repeat protein
MSQTAEDVGYNIVKIVDNRGTFNGTGFFVEIKQNRYCITCHHCICKLAEIYIEREDIRAPAEWTQFSDTNKDIAILKINDCSSIKALKYAREAMPKLHVSVWGFSFKDLMTFPQGSPVEDGKLSSTFFPFHWPEENLSGIQSWNKKPQVKVNVYRFSGNYDVGFSGAPVCYTGNNNVVGLFTAKDTNYGYVIPIQTLLEKFEDEKKIAKPAQTVDMKDYINKGNESFNKGEYDEAIKNYEVVLNDQNYFIALSNKGGALDGLGRHKEAIEWFDKALAIDPDNVKVLGNKGGALDTLGRHEEAIEWFDKALAIDPNDVIALCNKGVSLGHMGRHKEAIEWFDKALAIDPNYVIALCNKGVSLSDLGRYKEAIEWFDKALAIDPDNVKALGNKGVSLGHLGRYKEAIESYDKILAIDPNNDFSLNSKRNALARLRKEK